MDENAAIFGEYSFHLDETRPVPLNGFLRRAEVVVIVVKRFASVVQDVAVNQIYRFILKLCEQRKVVTVVDVDFISLIIRFHD